MELDAVPGDFMGLKLMVYQAQITGAAMSRDGKVMNIALLVVDCPKPSLGKGAALQNCLECESCDSITPIFVDCGFQSKQKQDQMRRQDARPTEMVRNEPEGVYNPKK